MKSLILRTALLASVLLLAAMTARAQSFTGTLADGDKIFDAGQPYDSYTIDLAEAQQVTITMRSDAFDTWLLVEGPDGSSFFNDDFEGQTTTSRITFVASAGGTWTIQAATYDASGRGDYSVEVQKGGTARVETISDRLDPRDTALPKGELMDSYERTITSSAPFSAELRSYGFDGYLVVVAPSGRTWRDDGSEDLARVTDLAVEPGTWRFIVTSSFADEVGAYDLRIITFP